MANDSSYKIFTSRNGAGDVSSSEMSCVGELPLIRSKTFSGGVKKPHSTFFNRSTLKTKSSKRVNRTKSAAHLNENQSQQQQDLNANEIKTTAVPTSSEDFPMENNDENKPKKNLNKTVQRHIAVAKKNACNISVMRQTLRANNKALAVALEIAKQEIKELKDENLQIKRLNQELQAHLNRLQEDTSSHEKRFEEAVETVVKMKMEEMVNEMRLNEVSELIDDMKHRMAKIQRKYVRNENNECETTLRVLNESNRQPITTPKLTPKLNFTRSRDSPTSIESPKIRSRDPSAPVETPQLLQEFSQHSFLDDLPTAEPPKIGGSDGETMGNAALRRSRRKTLVVNYKETKTALKKHRHQDRTVRRKKSTVINS